MSSKSMAEAEGMLRPEDRHMFCVLVEDYKELANAHVGMTVAHYGILAELVKRGWQKPIPTIDACDL